MAKLQGREDIPLNAAGVAQIKDTVNFFRKINWKVIVTSPLLRARSSAEIVAQEIGNIEIIEETDFVERDYGEASGMTPGERKIHFPDGKLTGEEPYEILQKRTVNALFKYIKKYEGNNIIIVSHGAAINSILAYLTNNEIGSGKTKLNNACISLLEKTDGKIDILFYNQNYSGE